MVVYPGPDALGLKSLAFLCWDVVGNIYSLIEDPWERIFDIGSFGWRGASPEQKVKEQVGSGPIGCGAVGGQQRMSVFDHSGDIVQQTLPMRLMKEELIEVP